MVGKMILPLLGGTPAVWSTCMVFFQAALLGGYAYAHATTAWLGIRRQTILHLALLAVPLAVLPLGVDASRLPGGEANPVLSVLVLLSLSVGLPFFVVSATAPLLQHWFTHTGHRAARDPYFLYAASNLGSMLALLSYPALIEPRLRLRDAGWLAQTRLWTLGYLLLAVLIVLCAVVAVRRSASRTAAALDAVATAPASAPSVEATSWSEPEPTIGRRLYWVALAFAPLEPAPRRHHLRHHGHRRPSPALGAPARDLPPELHHRVRPLAPCAPPGGAERPRCPSPSS
jgi:hypothetical protein